MGNILSMCSGTSHQDVQEEKMQPHPMELRPQQGSLTSRSIDGERRVGSEHWDKYLSSLNRTASNQTDRHVPSSHGSLQVLPGSSASGSFSSGRRGGREQSHGSLPTLQVTPSPRMKTFRYPMKETGDGGPKTWTASYKERKQSPRRNTNLKK